VNARTSNGAPLGRPERRSEGKRNDTMGNKAWMLVWAGVAVSAVLCVYAAVVN
jgi:hypothetical protein